MRKVSSLVFKALSVSAIAISMAHCPASARQLTLDEALSAARVESGSAIMRKAAASADRQITLRHTAQAEDLNTLYVVTTGTEGYMVLAADDVAVPLLGYSETGTFNPDSIPPAMAGWLDEYSAQIAAAARSGGKVIAAPRKFGRESLPPIVQTRWNQNSPYNNLCPKIGSSATYTGCVATAMAQVMKAHRWPLQPEGSNSYTWEKGGNVTLSMNFSGITFDWDNMADRYTGSESAASKNAVATLMKCCGYAAGMNYGTQASGANSLQATIGLVRNLGYDKSARYLSRANYSIADWTDMLYDELQQGYPLYYDGYGTGGHAFVIDGYNDPDGFFHVNWGWGGVSDGYFQITTLDPDSQGIGGSTAGYPDGQGAIFNLRKPADVTDSSYYLQVVLDGAFKTAAGTYSRTSGAQVQFLDGSSDFISNQSIITLNIDLGVKLKGTDGSERYVWWIYRTSTLDPNYGYRRYLVNASAFPKSGTYTVTPIFRVDGGIYDVKTPVNMTQALTLEATESTLVFTPVESTSKLSATDITCSPFYTGKTAQVTAKISNRGSEYYGEVYAGVLTPAKELYLFPSSIIDLMDGESETVTFTANLGQEFTEAAHQVGIYDKDYKLISELIDINVESAPTETHAITMSATPRFTWSLGGEGTISDPALVFSRQMKMEADVTCTQGYYSGQLYGYFFPMSGESSSTRITSPEFTLKAGETKTVRLDGDISNNLMTGEKYILQFRHKHSDSNSLQTIPGAPTSMYVQVTGTTSVEGVSADKPEEITVTPNPAYDVVTVSANDQLRRVTVYSMSGAEVMQTGFSGQACAETIDVSGLQSGHYIMRIETATGIATRRLIRR